MQSRNHLAAVVLLFVFAVANVDDVNRVAEHNVNNNPISISVTPRAASGNTSYMPLVGAFVGGDANPNNPADSCDNFCSMGRTVNDLGLSDRGGFDMLNDSGTGGASWHSITSQLPWASDTNDIGGNSLALGDLNFIKSRDKRAIVTSLYMFPEDLGQSYTYNGMTTSTCPFDPYQTDQPDRYNDDYVCMMEGVNGAFNSEWQSLGKSIVKDNLNTSQLILRIGWECGGNWMPWSAYVAGEANYAKYYQQIVQSVRDGISLAGQTPQVKFAWDCGTGVDLGDSKHPDSNYSSAALPGYPNNPNLYVDYLDFDPYDGGNGGFGITQGDWTTTTVGPPCQQNNLSTCRQGSLSWWSTYAGQHNMYLGFSEWGTHTNDAHYIQEVYDFIYAQSGGNYVNRVAYAAYEEHNATSEGGYDFSLDNQSAALSKYKSLFGSPSNAPQGVLPY